MTKFYFVRHWQSVAKVVDMITYSEKELCACP